MSTLPGGRYGRYSGTSMASPHVAGVAALIESQQPGPAGDAEIRSRILRSVDEKGNLQGKVATNGRLNALGALAEGTVQGADLTKPQVTAPRPAPGGSTRDRTPNISATVTDAESNLQKVDISFSVDGDPKGGFSYNADTDRLTYTPPRLAYGRHTVEVVAEEEPRQQRDHLHLGLQGGPPGPEITWSEGTRRAGVEAAALRLRGATRGCGKRSRPGACL